MQSRPLVGRDSELQQLASALRAADEGRGSSWFLVGEPGIGKSRLAEEVADRAAASGARVVWGRCWEAGGAPAYWPWIQVLRALLREDAERLDQCLGQRALYLVHLLPELASQLEAAELPPLGAERQRFELLDAISGALCDVRRSQPILVVLEDLHAADASSLSVFEVLGPQLRSSNMCVIGTYRDGDARLSPQRDALAAAAAQGTTLALSRLDSTQVQRFLAASLERTASENVGEDVRQAIYEATEGNPLFLTEVTRLLNTHTAWSPISVGGLAIPGNLRHTLRRRVESLSEVTRSGLEVGAVLGREFSGTLLAALWRRSVADTAAPLNEALDSGILIEAAPGEYRFSHVLLREVLHQDLPDERRTQLHLAAADLLRHRHGDSVLWSAVAHHQLEAGPQGREGAVEACQRAAVAAREQLAFSEARDWYTRALTALGQDPSADLEQRGELLLELADAELHSGAIETGKQTCLRAAALARELDRPELLAGAALTYGSVLLYATVDRNLVRLLEEALRALGDHESSLRAVVTARLAAAQQPAPQPEQPIALARDALHMAERLGDPETWLETARYAVSAMMDLGRPSERVALNREYMRVAEQLGRPLEVLRGRMRLAFDCFELGDLAGAEGTIDAIERAAQRLAHPFYTWRAHSFRAMIALFRGAFDEAEQHIERAQLLGQRARDPNVDRATAMQRFMLLRLQGREQEMLDMRPRLAEVSQGLELTDLLARLQSCIVLASVGHDAQARTLINGEDVDTVIDMADTSLLAPLIALAKINDDTELAERIERTLQAKESQFASGGMLMMVWDEPVALLLARCARLQGRRHDAEQHYQHAIELCERTGAAPFAAWARLELGELVLEEQPDNAAALLRAACDTARRLGMPGLEQRTNARLGVQPAEGADRNASTAPDLTPSMDPIARVEVHLQRDGEFWTLRAGGRSLRLRDTKGVQWLAELVKRAGHEVHVLDLVSPGLTRDAGDAGELLDDEAVQAYRRRASELNDELEEAEAFNDIGRANKARGELEFLKRELSRAVGLGNRSRRAGAAAERARINVQRRLRDAVKRIASLDSDLGQYIERSLSTGVFCCFRP